MAKSPVAISEIDYRLFAGYGLRWMSLKERQHNARIDLLRASRSPKVSQAQLDRLYEALSKARADQAAIERRIAKSVTRVFSHHDRRIAERP
jgi:hypothetical protein